MYAIMSGGALLALCDRPRYVKVNEEGLSGSTLRRRSRRRRALR